MKILITFLKTNQFCDSTQLDADTMIGNPDQIIEDQLYWCCRDNKSLSSCANDVVRTLNLYTLGNFACSITNKWPAFAWKSYEGLDSKYIYGLIILSDYY